ncbi:MAG TPA: aminoglycoside phosphotransferase family protein [Anaerolineae bacterium]|nr:aminoglycoside phosphotransferase family protein [Anaerolineae bacterium]
MKTERAIDKRALIHQIRRAYGLDVARLTFVPKGEVSYSYVADCAGGDRYFLKCLDASRLGKISASQLDFYLPLTWNLYSKGLFRNLPVPVRTRTGGFYTYFDGLPLVLFHFIAGRTLDDEHPLSDTTLVALARSVATIHKSTPEIGVENPCVERFDIPFEDDLLNGLDELKRVTRRDRWSKRALRDLLLPRKDEILGYLDHLRELQSVARTMRKDQVLCHTDLWGGNLIQGDDGSLYILDWEGAVLAPPEHDLYPFTGERFGVFLATYEREFRPVSLDGDIVRFYLYRRNLEDLTDWVFRILYENTNEEQDRNDLRGIVEDCMSGWPYLEDGISEVLDAPA